MSYGSAKTWGKIVAIDKTSITIKTNYYKSYYNSDKDLTGRSNGQAQLSINYDYPVYNRTNEAKLKYLSASKIVRKIKTMSHAEIIEFRTELTDANNKYGLLNSLYFDYDLQQYISEV